MTKVTNGLWSRIKKWYNHLMLNDLLEGVSELHYQHWKTEHAFSTSGNSG